MSYLIKHQKQLIFKYILPNLTLKSLTSLNPNKAHLSRNQSTHLLNHIPFEPWPNFLRFYHTSLLLFWTGVQTLTGFYSNFRRKMLIFIPFIFLIFANKLNVEAVETTTKRDDSIRNIEMFFKGFNLVMDVSGLIF